MTAWRWLGVVAILMAALPGAQAQDDATEATSAWLLIQTGKRAAFDGEHLTFVDTPTSVAFADRPRRLVADIPIEDFVEVVWHAGGPESLAAVPPNAALTFNVIETGHPGIAVVELREPTLLDDKLRYDIDVLEGELPSELGAITLVIDGFPLSGSHEVGALWGQTQSE